MPNSAAIAGAIPVGQAALAHERKRVVPLHRPRSFFGRYKVILVAVAFFLVFDLGVLILNFYTSFQISEDAIGVNLSGRQRMLSQRMTKALLAVDIERSRSGNEQGALDELKASVKLFDTTLNGFVNGAVVPGGDGKPVALAAATSDKARAALNGAQEIWATYKERLAPVLAGNSSNEQLALAVAFARSNNVKLLGLMNDLTNALEGTASERATTLRMVQTIGILLALLNFAFILYKFLRSLRQSDEAIETANEENREILQSVREGLFLLRPDFTLGTQISQSVSQLIGRPVRPGENLLATLQPLISEKSLNDARDYIELLFSPHVKEQLVQSINPLSDLEVTNQSRLGQPIKKHLAFSFNRVLSDKGVNHLLVTMQDITPRIELEQRLKEERTRAQKEFSMLIRAFETDPATLKQFVLRSEAQLLQVNDVLRSVSHTADPVQLRKAVDSAFRLVHSFKGEASALSLEVLTQLAEDLEARLVDLRDSPSLSGELLLNIPLPLESILEKISAFKALSLSRQTSLQISQTTSSVTDPSLEIYRGLEEKLRALAHKVARDLGKQIDCDITLHPLALTLPQWQGLSDICTQLIRNAIAHGVEEPSVRQAAGKSPVGKLSVKLMLAASGKPTLSVRDDGAGIEAAQIKQRLQVLGWYSKEQLSQFSDQQIVGHIFKPGFSTVGISNEHAGRGVGLDVVQAAAAQIDGRIGLTSTPGQFSEFRVSFS